MRSIFVLCLFASFAFPAISFAADTDDRAEKPARDKSAEARTKVREEFKDEYAKGSDEEVKAFAMKLMREGMREEENMPRRYALLTEAVSLSAKSGYAEGGIAAANTIARYFKVDRYGILHKVLSGMSGKMKDDEERADLAKKLLALAQSAMEDMSFEIAGKALESAGQVAVIVGDEKLIKTIENNKKYNVTQAAALGKVASAQATLKANPDDSGANLIIGKYYAFNKSDWNKAMPYLAKSADPDLSAIAKMELSGAYEREDMIDLGDKYWNVSETSGKNHREAIRLRAAHWYEKALPGARGISKNILQDKIQQALNP